MKGWSKQKLAAWSIWAGRRGPTANPAPGAPRCDRCITRFSARCYQCIYRRRVRGTIVSAPSWAELEVVRARVSAGLGA